MWNDSRELMPGDRVYVFDARLFENDFDTPLSYTMRPATIVCRYGSRPSWRVKNWHLLSLSDKPDPDLVDVRFDYRSDEISRGHFTSFVDTEEPGVLAK